MKSPEQIRNELSQMVGKGVQTSVAIIMSQEHPSTAIPESVHLGCNVALCSLVPIVPFLSKRPNLTPEEAREKGADELVKLLTYERLLFAALIVARMQGDIIVSRDHLHTEHGEGCEVSQEVNFGPYVMGQALEDWKKVTGKDPADYLDHRVLEAIASNEAESLAPFEEFLKGRKIAPSSKTLN